MASFRSRGTAAVHLHLLSRLVTHIVPVCVSDVSHSQRFVRWELATAPWEPSKTLCTLSTRSNRFAEVCKNSIKGCQDFVQDDTNSAEGLQRLPPGILIQTR